MKVDTYGFALIFALLVIVIAGALLTGLFFSINTSLNITSNDLKAAQAKSFAEMGLNRFQTIAHQNYAFYVEHWEDYNLTDEQLENLQCGTTNLLSLGLDLDRLRDGPFKGRIGDNTRTIDVFVDNPFEEHDPLPDGVVGGYVITLANEGKTLTSEGYLGKSLSEANARSRVIVSFSESSSDNPYKNAVFVGGQQGKISGSVAIYGSIHLMGNPADGISLDIIGGGIYNNYYGKKDQASNISADVEALTGISANNVPDLCTQLKVKSGTVSHNDTSPIGWSNADSSENIPFEIAALYLDALLSGSDPHTRKEQEDYLSEMDINMPKIPSNYPDDVSSAVNLSSCPDFIDDISGSSLDLGNADVGDSCFSNGSFIALVNSISVCDSITISFLASSFTPDSIPNLVETIKNHSIGNGKILCINGDINTGNLNLVLNNTNYQGQGTLRAGIGVGGALDGAIEADINISGSITPANGDFPAGSSLGLVSNHNINIDGSLNESHAFIAFAEDAINISKQVTIVGSLVASTLEVSGVPKIAYVPEVDQVAANLTGLPRLGDLPPSAELNIVAYERR